MNDLARIEKKLDDLISIVSPGGAPVGTSVEPPDCPEMSSQEINPSLADGVNVFKDGSTWIVSMGEAGPVGTLRQVVYGYISERKNPAMWGRMVALLGEERLRETLAVHGPFARYKTNPDAVLLAGDPNAVTLGMMLSQPLPAMPPTA